MNPDVFHAASSGASRFNENLSESVVNFNHMWSNVFEAASSGASSFFQNLADRSIISRQVTVGKNTILHVALQFKHLEATATIVKLFPDLVFEVNSRGDTPLHIAARTGEHSLVELLMGQDIGTGGQQKLLRMVNLDGDNALHVAVRHASTAVVKELINNYDTVNLVSQKNNAGDSALFLAVDRQDYDMATYILRSAPECCYDGRHGMNVLHALVIHTSAYSNKDNSVCQILGDIEEYKMEHEKAGFISRRLLIVTFVWVVNMLFLIPLHNVLMNPYESAVTQPDDVRRLRRAGTIPSDLVQEVMEKWPFTISQRDDSGWTPLHIAAHLGNGVFVEMLLRKGNTPAYVRNKEGLSAFHIAAKEGHYEVMDVLMKACPDIYELLDNRGRNALHTAAESGCWAAINFLGTQEVFEGLVNEQDKEGNTPSHLAAINGYTYMAEILLNGEQIVLNATNKEGFTTMDNVLTSKLHSREVRKLWFLGARLSLRGVLLKVGVQNLDPRRKTELAGHGDGDGDCNGKSCGDGNGNDKGMSNSDFLKQVREGDGHGDGDCNGKSCGDGNGNDKGMSNSDFLKQVREGNMLVATLIATVTFAAAFTVPGGFIQNGNVDEGLAVLSKVTAYRVFLITNTLAFGLSATSVFVHFLALTTSEEIAFNRKIERRTAFYTNWSIGAMLFAFVAGTYAVVPHPWGIAVAVLLSSCFLSSLFLPVTIKDYSKYA